MMKKIFISIVGLFLSAYLCNAQLLWEISGKGMHTKSYIFATDKLIPISFLDTVPQLYAIYAKCPIVVTEMLLNVDTRSKIEKAALLPQPQNLRSFYDPTECALIDTVLSASLKMDFNQLAIFRPIFLTELYKTELYKQYLGYEEEKSSEIFFQLVATEQGKRILPLDNAEEAIYATFYRKNLDTQAQELLRLIENPEDEIEHKREQLQYYRKGLITDISYSIQAPANKTTINYIDYQAIVKRNARWATQIPALMKMGSCFIVLNVDYLGGDNGLLQMLRNEGYRVRPANRNRLKLGKKK